MTSRANAISAIAYLVSLIRPEWDRPGVERVLHRLPDASLAQLAHAAVVAAETRKDQRTPAVIAMTGPHWGGCMDTPPKRPVSLTERLASEKPTTPAPPETRAECLARIRAAAERREETRHDMPTK